METAVYSGNMTRYTGLWP